MSKPKLSYAMVAALEAATERDVDFYQLMRVGASGATTTSLVKRGLLTDRRCADGRLWSIADAGRDWLAARTRRSEPEGE